MRTSIITACCFTLAGSLGHCQGLINLGFEDAKVVFSVPGPIDADNALHGWTAYIGSAHVTSIAYNAVSLGGAMVSLQDTNANGWGPPLPLAGNYSVFLQAGFMGDTTPAGVGQTGTIPLSARSLTFWGDNPWLVMSFGNQILNYTEVSATDSYRILVADISQFAGQTGELRFTAPTGARGVLDNIQFSTVPVPEPGVLTLTAIGALLFLGRRQK